MNLNSPPSHFPMHQISHGNDHEQYDHHPFVPNRPSSLSCHFFFDSTQDHTGFYDHHQLYQPSHRVVDEKYGCRGAPTTYEMKSKVNDGGLKLSLWNKESDEVESKNNSNPMKWMSSKMRVMQKLKKTRNNNADNQKVQASSSSAETDLSSNSSSYNNNSNAPIRVCSDCNTTKTPLWRSGPKGPKSLCNACGIRQRKARRAMAAAANGAAASHPPAPTTTTKIKLQQKGKNNGHASSQMKKRCKTAVAAAAGSPPKQIGFEDFLINLSKNLAFHRVFPDDEKDAAILLMALSSGLVNG